MTRSRLVRQNAADRSSVGLTRVTMGGEREPGGKRDSSTCGSPLSNLALPWSVLFSRSKQNQMSAIVNTTVAIPPTTPVKEMGDMGSCDDDSRRPAYHQRLHLCDSRTDRQNRRSYLLMDAGWMRLNLSRGG